MTGEYFKAVRLDMTSHRDAKWRKGGVIKVSNPDPADVGPRGRGIHCSPTLLDAVSWQQGPSIYCRVAPLEIIASDQTKARCSGVKVLDWLSPAETDALAGFKLWEANHSVNPLLLRPRRDLDLPVLVAEWASARVSAQDSVWTSMWTSMWASAQDSVRDSAQDSVWAYIGGLFPNVKRWHGVEGPDPWRPLLTLWYGGYIPSFDGKTWRLHAHKDAQIVWPGGGRGAAGG